MKRTRRNINVKEVVGAAPKERIRRKRRRRSVVSIRNMSQVEKAVERSIKTRSEVPKKTRMKWKPEFLRILYHMSLLGAKEADIATALGVKVEAIAVWKRNRPGVKQALRDGKILADAKMAESFYAAGVGYSHPETKLIPNRVKTFNEKGKIISDELKIERVEVTKHYPPNVTAGAKWLKGRHPDLWGDDLSGVNKQVININSINFADFSNQELELLTKMGFQQTGKTIPALAKGESSFAEFEEVEEEIDDEETNKESKE